MRATGVLIGLLGAAAAAAATTVAHATPRKPPPPAQVDDPCTDAGCAHHALDAFSAAVAAQKAHSADHPLRVSWFGDSLTADDHITNALRDRLGALLGDGGPGFVFAMPPHPYCQHHRIARVSNGVWRVNGVSSVPATDHLLGLGGSAESDGDASIRFVPTSPIHTVDVHYLAQPHGGSVALLADGKEIAVIATAGDHKQAAFSRLAVPDGTKKLELRAHGRVRLFGASLEAEHGAVVDNLGVVNATAKQLRNHNLPEHWEHQLAHRASDLVVIMLGTNEAEWIPAKGTAMTEHEELFGALLASVRAGNPHASCLVVSPLDQIDYKDPLMPPRASIPAMVEAQHRAALAHGCAFWDTYQWMGGKGASAGWFKRGLVVKDYQHPTSEGAERIAAALFAGLVR